MKSIDAMRTVRVDSLRDASTFTRGAEEIDCSIAANCTARGWEELTTEDEEVLVGKRLSREDAEPRRACIRFDAGRVDATPSFGAGPGAAAAGV
jgi:hypothetical protein